MTSPLRAMTLASTLLLLTGCGTVPTRAVPPTATLPARALVDLDAAPGSYPVYNPEKAMQLLRTDRVPIHPTDEPDPRNLLALSGGGMYGAYSAGVLKGWTASGTRPKFDVVTGISTGSLIAPFAFLGPEYDDHLEQKYTTVKATDIYRIRPWLSIPFAPSVAESAPLRAMIASEVNDALLAQIAAEHAKGRRLYVGTTNLDSKRLTVWDMGAIAGSPHPGRLQLFRNVLLASCSVPGVLPPVEIAVLVNGKRYTEMHADGGVAASIFLDPYMLFGDKTDATATTGLPAGPNIYAIVAGKLYVEPGEVQPRFFSVAGQSLTGVLQAQFEGNLMRLFLMSKLTGGSFQLTAVPQDVPIGDSSLSFDPVIMRRCFDVGYQLSSQGKQWRTLPPGSEPMEQRQPRAGVEFATINGANPATAPASSPPPVGIISGGTDGLQR